MVIAIEASPSSSRTATRAGEPERRARRDAANVGRALPDTSQPVAAAGPATAGGAAGTATAAARPSRARRRARASPAGAPTAVCRSRPSAAPTGAGALAEPAGQ